MSLSSEVALALGELAATEDPNQKQQCNPRCHEGAIRLREGQNHDCADHRPHRERFHCASLMRFLARFRGGDEQVVVVGLRQAPLGL